VWVGKVNVQQLEGFVQQHRLKGIVDASHPYATVISESAIAISLRLCLPYLRYERPKLNQRATHILSLDSFTTLLQGNYLNQQRVLLTIGTKVLPQFQPLQEKATLFTRILPRIDSLQVALNSGFTPDRIIALRPPIEATFEKALWQQWKITTVVTKASGTAGGEARKAKIAAQLGVRLIVIERPPLDYPQQTNEVETVVRFAQEVIQNSSE
jgi:precorrin-6A/cobalt-precorrin-6A reductase